MGEIVNPERRDHPDDRFDGSPYNAAEQDWLSAYPGSVIRRQRREKQHLKREGGNR